MKSVFTGIIKLCLCFVVTLAYLNMAHADGDTLSSGIEKCDGIYAFALGRSGTCDSNNDCKTQRNCPDPGPGPDTVSGCGFHATNKCQTEDNFDCDTENDDIEYGIAGKDPTVSAIAQTDHDNDLLFDNCDPDMDGDGLLNTADACPLDIRLAGTVNGYDNNCSQISWRPHTGNPPAIDGNVANDVGWSCAHPVTLGNGTDLPHVVFRGLKDRTSDFFYLSFEVKNDSNGLTNDDMIIVTFRPNVDLSGTSFEPDNQANDLRFIITPNYISRYNDAVIVSKYTTRWEKISSPTGFQFAKTSGNNFWNIEIKLPFSSTTGGTGWPTFGDDFKFFFDVILNDGSDSTEFVWPHHNHRINGDILNYPYFASEWGVGTKDPAKYDNCIAPPTPPMINPPTILQ